MLIWCNFDRDTFYDFQSVPDQSGSFFGVVGDQLDLFDPPEAV